MFCHLTPLPALLSFYMLFACLILSSCETNRLEVDVSDIQVPEVYVSRFDRDFFALNAGNISRSLPEMQEKYPGFTDLFVKNILCPRGITDSACIPEIIRFVTDKDMRAAYDDCQKVFPDLNQTEQKLTDVFRHYNYYYPNAKLPHVVAMMSGFNYAIAAADSSFSIGLEMYLGSKARFYEMIQFPNYKRVNMRKEYIVTDLVHAWMAKAFPNTNKSGTLLNEMIYQGKLLYLEDALMPDTHDSIKIGFTKNQLDWCVENENNMWGFLIKNKLLYSNDITMVTKFTGEAPFTTGFVKESPGRTGVWIGWQIVRKYVGSNPSITFEQLMQEIDAQKILSMSKYKP
ncbi:MAG: gliding motility lipoprotein GldB [Bacteroidetes bacterium]|nr:MAG: gliding motility lipoprotein GldB [Bacteroidota bacterium]